MKYNKIVAGFGLLGTLSACTVGHYVERPLDPDRSLRAFESRSVSAPALRDFMAAHGQKTWPIATWGLTELTLLALYFNPELQVAQAQARAAASEVALAGGKSRVALAPRVEHHDGGPTAKPWSVGVALEYPVGGSDKREAASAQAAFIAQAAELNVGVVAWKIRHDLRSALLERIATDRQVTLLDEEIAARAQLQRLLERRRDLGLISGHEPAVAQLQLLELQQARGAAITHALETTQQLAAIVGLPLTMVQALPLSIEDDEWARSNIEQPAREALLNRLDLRRRLAEFAAADAAVKLEVAKQRPELSLSPGFLWDQGDNVWSLAANILLPRDHSALIGAAHAKRELAAQEFLQLQAQVINEATAAARLLRLALEQLDSFEQASRAQQGKLASMTRQFDAGYADRVDLAEARIQTFAALRELAQAQLRAQRAWGSLEDVVQRPLNGFPLTHEELSSTELARR